MEKLVKNHTCTVAHTFSVVGGELKGHRLHSSSHLTIIENKSTYDCEYALGENPAFKKISKISKLDNNLYDFYFYFNIIISISSFLSKHYDINL